MRWIVHNIFQLIQFLILVRVILSWISHDSYNQYIRIIYVLTDIVLNPIREFLPFNNAPFDVSPIIANFLIDFLKNILLNLI